MPKFAVHTKVKVKDSRDDIESALRRYGAKQFVYAWSEHSGMVGFNYKGLTIRFDLTLPKADDLRTPKGRKMRNPEVAREQLERQQWRAMYLGILAKLELVDSGITTFEQEFLAHVVLPDGSTFGRWAAPQLKTICDHGMPPLLPEAVRTPENERG